MSNPENTNEPQPAPKPTESETAPRSAEVSTEQTAATPAAHSSPAVAVEATDSTTSKAANGGLPEWEPLTPELVEEEAIRGDFMLRWAVILLALLIGCRQIVETTTLTHVKTGRYLASHGFWPPSTDVFSSTASEQRWVNLAWLWDLIASGLFAFREGVGLSVVTALLVATTWWLLGRISRENVSTWWNSILAALTLLACHLQFSGQPETITLLGLAATLWCLHDWTTAISSRQDRTTSRDSRGLWWLVPGFALWSNLDPRLFLGLLLLLCWGLGDAIGRVFERGSLSATHARQYWLVVGACCVASLLNPFGWQSLWSPVVLYGTEYPAWRTYAATSFGLEDGGAFPLWTSELWSPGPSRLPLFAGTTVLVAALVSLLLNLRKVHLGDVLVFAAFVVLAFLAAHELAAASLVACVLGTLNAQQWYQANFRQTYSVATGELLFTRGGRAVTVLAFFALAIMAVNQSLFGPGGKRLGLGLSNTLSALIDAYRSATAEAFDDRPFNFAYRQGDVLLWLDQKPFVDSRVALFSSLAGEDLLRLHDDARRSLTGLSTRRPSPDGQPDSGAAAAGKVSWKSIFDRYQLTHAMPRLVGVSPTSYFRMLFSSEWRLTHLGANCAVFYRTDKASPELSEFLQAHRLNFVEAAFQKDGQSVIRVDWPRPRSSFQKYLTAASPPVSNKVLEAENLAMHWQALGEGQLLIERPTAAAMALLVIRQANEVLADQPDNAAAFQVLGDAYLFLMELETEIAQNAGQSLTNQMRYYQTLAAYQQAVLLEPDSLGLHGRLLNLFQTHRRTDLMLRELETLERLVARLRPNDPSAEELAQQRLLLMEQCRSRIDEIREQIAKATAAGQSPLELAQQVYAAGFILEAQQLLDQNPAAVSQSPQGLLLRAVLQFESGKIEEAHRTFEFELPADPATRMVAAWTKLAHGEYDKASKLWQDQAEFYRQTALTQVLTTLPLAQSPYAFLGLPNVWPTQHALTVADAQQRLTDDVSTLIWYQSLSQLESAKPQLAAKTLRGLLDVYPETPFRPLVRFYWQAMTGEAIDPEPPSEWIPIDADMFAPDDPEQADKN